MVQQLELSGWQCSTGLGRKSLPFSLLFLLQKALRQTLSGSALTTETSGEWFRFCPQSELHGGELQRTGFCSVQTRCPNTEWHASLCVVSMRGISWDMWLPRITLSGPMSHSKDSTHLVYRPRKRQISCIQRVFSCSNLCNGRTWCLENSLHVKCRHIKTSVCFGSFF